MLFFVDEIIATEDPGRERKKEKNKLAPDYMNAVLRTALKNSSGGLLLWEGLLIQGVFYYGGWGGGVRMINPSKKGKKDQPLSVE